MLYRPPCQVVVLPEAREPAPLEATYGQSVGNGALYLSAGVWNRLDWGTGPATGLKGPDDLQATRTYLVKTSRGQRKV